MLLDCNDFFTIEKNWAWDVPTIEPISFFSSEIRFMEQEDIDEMGLSQRKLKEKARREIILDKITRQKQKANRKKDVDTKKYRKVCHRN